MSSRVSLKKGEKTIFMKIFAEIRMLYLRIFEAIIALSILLLPILSFDYDRLVINSNSILNEFEIALNKLPFSETKWATALYGPKANTNKETVVKNQYI